ncbi:MAG TPA: cysteine desulfurase family protein [Acidimicrobiales bacterium]|nr:cysteine desulfurase family protein [Acidimicrobiales bacterium]
MRAYLDHAATAPTRPEAAEAMLPWLTGRFGNPSGSHAVARDARRAVDEARAALAGVLGAAPGEVVCTGGGTEADVLAILGTLAARRRAGLPAGVVVTSAIEHAAVRNAAAGAGVPLREAPVGADGVLDLDALADTLDPDVALVSLMLVNNEVGTVQPLAAATDLVRRRAPGAVVHTDAVQALTWLDLRGEAACADLVSISAHKFGGPQGVGALVVREGTPLVAVVEGGGQERERRGGTHNVAGIVGMASAAAATDRERPTVGPAVAARRDRLVAGLLAAVPGAEATVGYGPVAPGFAHLCIEGVESEALLVLLDEAGVCASAGSACASGGLHASHVLLAMGIAEERALGSLRLTLGPTTTDAEVDVALEAVPAAVARLRAG